MILRENQTVPGVGHIAVDGSADTSRSQPLRKAALRVMAAAADADAVHVSRIDPNGDAGDDGLGPACPEALRRVAALMRMCVVAHNDVSAALETLVAKNPPRLAGLLDEMHVLRGAAHRAELKKMGIGAAAGNLYNSVRAAAAAASSKQKKKKKDFFFLNFFFFFFLCR